MRRWINLFLLLRFTQLVHSQLCNPLAGLFNLFRGGGGGCGQCCPPPCCPPPPCQSSGCSRGGFPPPSYPQPQYSNPYPQFQPQPFAYQAQQVPPASNPLIPSYGMGSLGNAGSLIPTYAGPIPPAPRYGQLSQGSSQPASLNKGSSGPGYILQEVNGNTNYLNQSPNPSKTGISKYAPIGYMLPSSFSTATQKIPALQKVVQPQTGQEDYEEEPTEGMESNYANQNGKNEEKTGEYDLEEEPSHPYAPISKPISIPSGPIPPPPPSDYEDGEETQPLPPLPDQGTDYEEEPEPPMISTTTQPRTQGPDYVLNYPAASPISTLSYRVSVYPITDPPSTVGASRSYAVPAPAPYNPPYNNPNDGGTEYEDEMNQEEPITSTLTPYQPVTVPPAPYQAPDTVPPVPYQATEPPAPYQAPVTEPPYQPIVTQPPYEPVTEPVQATSEAYVPHAQVDNYGAPVQAPERPEPAPPLASTGPDSYPANPEPYPANPVPVPANPDPYASNQVPTEPPPPPVDPNPYQPNPVTAPPPPNPDPYSNPPPPPTNPNPYQPASSTVPSPPPPQPAPSPTKTEYEPQDYSEEVNFDSKALSIPIIPPAPLATSDRYQPLAPSPAYPPPNDPYEAQVVPDQGQSQEKTAAPAQIGGGPDADTEWHVDPKVPIPIPKPIPSRLNIVKTPVDDNDVDTPFALPDRQGLSSLFDVTPKTGPPMAHLGPGKPFSSPYNVPPSAHAIGLLNTNPTAPSGYDSSPEMAAGNFALASDYSEEIGVTAPPESGYRRSRKRRLIKIRKIFHRASRRI